MEFAVGDRFEMIGDGWKNRNRPGTELEIASIKGLNVHFTEKTWMPISSLEYFLAGKDMKWFLKRVGQPQNVAVVIQACPFERAQEIPGMIIAYEAGYSTEATEQIIETKGHELIRLAQRTMRDFGVCELTGVPLDVKVQTAGWLVYLTRICPECSK